MQKVQRFFPVSWVTCRGIQSNKFNFRVIFVCIFVVHIYGRMCSRQHLLVANIITESVLKPWMTLLLLTSL